MLYSTITVLAGLAASAFAAQSGRTFAVNHFYGKGPLVEGRMDPIVSPGQASGHVHTIQSGNNFAMTLSDTALLDSTCTSSLIKNDKSAYWTPKLYFQDPTNASFIDVPLFYMNVYYFFEATDDDIVAFQPGHRMFVGDTTLRTPPATGGASITDANAGTPQPVQWTCPRSNYDIPSYPADSDGLHGVGIQDPNNQGAGVGFPDMNCDGYASPLRADIHFPSCYNPAAGLDDYKNNMQWPSSAGTTGGKQNCPEGWIHTPHIFYEVYWNTPLFVDLWEQGQGSQPFVLSNGDRTGYSLHADFISGWDVPTLQQIIDNCDAGDSGMDQCPGLIGGVNDPSTSCNIDSPVQETITGVLQALPGNNPVSGWGEGAPPAISSSTTSSTTSVGASAPTISVSTVSTTSNSVVSVSSIGSPVGTSTSSALGYSGSVSSYGSTSAATTFSTSTATSTSATTTTATGVASPTGISSVPGWSYSGCWSDDRYSRVLSGITFADLGVGEVTTTGCISYCGSEGFGIAGTEYAGQCFCGNALVGSSQVAESLCKMPCEGDESQICGGSLTLSVYEKSGASKSRRHVHEHGAVRWQGPRLLKA